MSELDSELDLRLAELREQGLHRQLQRADSPQSSRIRIGDQSLLNFCSNDYLGLANHPEIKAAAVGAIGRYGAGAGSSRLICGSMTPHHQLESALAQFLRTEAALSFSSGYATAMGTICALAGKDDVLILDKLVHACVVDAARLSGAKLRVFRHNDIENLEALLKWAVSRPRASSRPPRILIVTESVFSMDGDLAPLRDLVDLKEKYGAWLMLDEAHATGVFGSQGRGLAAACGVSDRVDIHMGTLGKALGSAGGYICGSRVLVDYLINRARSFIFSTAPPPAAAAAAAAAVGLLQSPAGENRCRSLRERIAEFSESPDPDRAPARTAERAASARSAIFPWMIGAEADAVKTAASMRQRGFLIPAIRYPTVARNRARLRVTLTAGHSAEDVRRLKAEMARLDVRL